MTRQNDEFEAKFYQMDPEVDRLLFDGTRLRNGMWVMIAEPDMRVETEAPITPVGGAYAYARKYNRWTEVSELEVQYFDGERMVAFIGTYDDGTQSKFRVDLNYSWWVKLHSLEGIDLTKEPEWDLDELVRKETNNPNWNREEDPIQDEGVSDPPCRAGKDGAEGMSCTKPASHTDHTGNPHADYQGNIWFNPRGTHIIEVPAEMYYGGDRYFWASPDNVSLPPSPLSRQEIEYWSKQQPFCEGIFKGL